MRKILLATIGVLAASLGGLWLLQGIGIVNIEPIICVAECRAIQGPSFVWTAVGFLAFMAGAVMVFRSLRRHR